MKKLLSGFVSLIFLFAIVMPIVADEGQINDLQKQIEDLTRKIEAAQSQERTLNAEIKAMDQKIKLTTLQIAETAEKIKQLGKEILELNRKIERLDETLTKLSELLINRMVTSYKISRVSYLTLILSGNGITDFINRTKYIQLAQKHDQQVMTEVQLAKTNFSEQKELREQKKKQQEALRKQLETQQTQLNQQKRNKNLLLEQTKNSEAIYQSLLTRTRAELEAIKSILSGGVVEVKIGHINEGEVVANIIPAASCNSSGAHLHFMVVQGGNSINPFNQLKSGVNFDNCSTNSCDSSEGDPFNPSGSWIWPLNGKIILTQGFGVTWAVRNTYVGNIYSSHNGIDIYADSSVIAVKSGTLYKGAFVGNNCNLLYVKVDHDDSDLDTLYLHVYPS